MKMFKLKISVLFIVLAAAIFGQTCTVTQTSKSQTINQVQPSKDSVIKILAIGNSFSDDAIMHYLFDLAKAGGYKVIIGNLYIGGAPLELHVKNVLTNKDSYTYWKIGVDGKKKQTPKTSIATGLADEKWDYISFQQASPKSGLYETYVEPLPVLFNYVKEKATNPRVRYIWHQTWAYAQTSPHKGFASYNNNQVEMYNGIMDASKKAMKLLPFDILVPAGTAIQNARTKLGDVMCRDGYHLDLNIGRYTASCVWYETIFKQNVVGNSYKPENVSAADALVGQEAAHKAIVKPYKISEIK